MSKHNGKPETIPALAYLRKSTKGTRADGSERQEKSLGQQKAESNKVAAAGSFNIVEWFEDDGISGTKRGHQRPSFQRMLDSAQSHQAQAIICDNIDRFSRATVNEVWDDANTLKRAGVRYIVTASYGTYDLGRPHDIGEILKFVIAVWSANEYSRQLGRRISLARRNRAVEGLRTGGRAPYGMLMADREGKPITPEDRGKRRGCTLVLGDPEEIKWVRWAFDQFVNQHRSANWIAVELNRKAIRGPGGGKWFPVTVRDLLAKRAYRGDFSYNENGSGMHFRIDAKGEVIEAADYDGDGKVFVVEGVYPAIIDPSMWDKARRRLELLATNRSRRKRMGYPLSGLLVCDHCGKALYGITIGNNVVYRCGSGAAGLSDCATYQVRQDEILPVVMQLLGREIDDIRKLLTDPPTELREPHKQQATQRAAQQRQRDSLAKQITKAEENILFVEDARTRQALDRRLTELRDRLEQLEAALTDAPPTTKRYNRDDLEALNAWWDDFMARAVSLPTAGAKPGAVPWEAHFYADPQEPDAVLVDSRKVNEALHQLGAEVRLRWTTQQYVTRGGKPRRRHLLVRGRLRLGQQRGKLPQYVLQGSLQRPYRAVADLPTTPGSPSSEGSRRFLAKPEKHAALGLL